VLRLRQGNIACTLLAAGFFCLIVLVIGFIFNFALE
jgi:hypothetical protein